MSEENNFMDNLSANDTINSILFKQITAADLAIFIIPVLKMLVFYLQKAAFSCDNMMLEYKTEAKTCVPVLLIRQT